MNQEVKTSGMKLSEIRPCDSCGKKIAPIFHVVEIKLAVFNQQNVNAVLGTSQIFGHQSLALAEVMAPGAYNAVEVLEDPDATLRLFICQPCYCGELNLAVITERLDDLVRRRAEGEISA